MRKTTAAILLAILVTAGCTTVPNDISGKSTYAELEPFVGRLVTFSGTVVHHPQNQKQTGVSNGSLCVVDYTRNSWSFCYGDHRTITGVLRKVTIAPSRDAPPASDGHRSAPSVTKPEAMQRDPLEALYEDLRARANEPRRSQEEAAGTTYYTMTSPPD
jgi:hypothetical protein